MKKNVLFIIIGVIIFIVVCYFGYKALTTDKLICSSDNASDTVAITQKYIIEYSKKDVTFVTITKKFAYKDQAKFDSFNAVVIPGTQENFNNLENDYIKFSDSVKGKTYSYKLTVNVKKASKSDISQVGLNQTLKTLKADLEQQGLTCK